MLGHPSLTLEQARLLAPSGRAFFCWYWKAARQAGLFPVPASSLPPPPPPSKERAEAPGGVLFCRISRVYPKSCAAYQCPGVPCNTRTKSNGLD